MVTTKFYLDTRKVLKGGQGYSLRINITQNRKIASYPLGISLTEKQWNAQTEKVVGHPEAMMYNKFIAARKIEVDTIILKLADEGKLGDMTAVQIRDYIQSVLNPKRRKSAESCGGPEHRSKGVRAFHRPQEKSSHEGNLLHYLQPYQSSPHGGRFQNP